MTRYADPTRCPDCGATITQGAAACPACGLSLRGDTAQRLFSTLSLADDLLAVLRSATVSAAPVSMVPSTPYPASAVVRRRARLSSATVPQILLALGAGCLLVAALVFLAVTWSVLGVGGRTATLVSLTVVAGGLSAVLARRSLRGAAESLALVGFGLLALDVVGADRAGWFGDVSTAALMMVVGAVLVASGTAGALGGRRTPLGALVAGELAVAVGAAVLAAGLGVAEWFPVSVAVTIATVTAGVVTVGALRLRLRIAAAGSAVVAAAAWLSLTSIALDRTFDQPTWSALWLDRETWPLLVAAGLVAMLATVRRLPVVARVSAASVAGLLLAVAATAPATRLSPTTVSLVGVGVLLVAGAVSLLLPRRWALAPLATQAVAGVGVLGLVLVQGATAAGRLLETADEPWAGRLADRLPPADAGLPVAWLLPLALLVLLGTLAVLAEASTLVDRAVAAVLEVQVAVVALLAAGVAGSLALYPLALWLVVGLLLFVASALTAWAVAGRTRAPLAPGTAFLAAALVVGLHAAWLTAAPLAVTLALTALVHLSSRSVTLSAASGAVLSATLAASAWTAGHLLGADGTWVAAAGLVVLGALVLGAPYAPRRWWVAQEPVLCRTGLEVGAAAAAFPLAAAGLLVADPAYVATWTAGYLTVAGAMVTVMSLLREDRRSVAWVGGSLLALASWVRLADLGVTAPEAYTLPSAAALLAVGAWQLRKRSEASTLSTLAPGLSLALVPSLLWVLAEPSGPRPLLLGLACLGLLLGGARLRWTAPVLLGATVGALVVLRLAAPYLGDAVPRWVLIGGAGALLIAVGATWERRLTEARHLMGRVREMR
ncbi:MAG: zinc ribbon domain-containing protein [Nocardioidaceae bacterium]